MTGSRPTTGRRVAVTGAAGSLATDVIPGLVDRGYEVVGVDNRPVPPARGVIPVLASVNDRSALSAAFEGCQAVVHLAGIPLEADWADLLHINIDGTQAVLETVRRLGIARAVLASSIHAVGFVTVPTEGELVPDDVPVRPNTFYGVSKAALEALGSLYHHRHGIDVVCLRIASRFAEPEGERMLSTWLSPADAVRLVDAALTVESPGFRTVWGVSANDRSYLASDGGRAIGFEPQDNAEDYASLLSERGVGDPGVLASEWDRRYIGGIFSSPTPPRFTGRDEAAGQSAAREPVVEPGRMDGNTDR